METLQARWTVDKLDGVHHAEVFIAGKWRLMSPKCRNHRPITPKELLNIRRTIDINTGGHVDYELEFKV